MFSDNSDKMGFFFMALPLQRLDFSVADILLYQSMGVVWPKVLRRLVCRFFSIIFTQIKKAFYKSYEFRMLMPPIEFCRFVSLSYAIIILY